jgi:cobalt-precorrin 5A hydrolase/precorrin-3B C17-methyltransferase
MAGLVFETLQAQGWDGKTPTVASYPGITALQAAAARVGAPLMHDFCAISLSDLLTPWPVIEKRLKAAAEADFVVALYNPKSQKRTEQIAIAQQLLAQHRAADTPVAIVQSAYRPTESILLTTLADMLSHPIDMLTTVIIGNRSTRIYGERLITPRGYEVGG